MEIQGPEGRWRAIFNGTKVYVLSTYTNARIKRISVDLVFILNYGLFQII